MTHLEQQLRALVAANLGPASPSERVAQGNELQALLNVATLAQLLELLDEARSEGLAGMPLRRYDMLPDGRGVMTLAGPNGEWVRFADLVAPCEVKAIVKN